MKILKHGQDPKTIPVRGDCMNCKTAIEFMPSEAKKVFDPDPRGGDFYEVRCPTCWHLIHVHVRRSQGL